MTKHIFLSKKKPKLHTHTLRYDISSLQGYDIVVTHAYKINNLIWIQVMERRKLIKEISNHCHDCSSSHFLLYWHPVDLCNHLSSDSYIILIGFSISKCRINYITGLTNSSLTASNWSNEEDRLNEVMCPLPTFVLLRCLVSRLLVLLALGYFILGLWHSILLTYHYPA